MFLYQPSKGYRYNSDSIFLYDFIRLFKPKGKVLDVGCGVGIVGLLVARDFPVSMSIVDIQKHMIEYAERNYEANEIDVLSYVSDFDEFDEGERYEYIISNPPFYDSAVTQSEDEHVNIARYSHHLPLAKFVNSAKKLLKPRGFFIFCYDAKQVDAALAQLRESKLNPEVLRFVHPKADREAKIVLIVARANSRSMIKVLPPLIVFDANNGYTPEAQAAFDHAGTNVVTADADHDGKPI